MKKIISQKGSAIAYALIIMTAVSFILVASIRFVNEQLKYGFFVNSKEQSLQVAEAGAQFYRWYLSHNTDGKSALQIENFWKNGNPYGVNPEGYEAEYKNPSGTPIGKYLINVTPPETGSTIVIVKSTGWTYNHPETKRIVQVRFRRPTWSEYAVLSNEMIRFGDGTHIYGKVFSNSGIHIDGVAHNTVYSAVSTYYDKDVDVKAWKPGVWTAWPDEYNSNMTSDVFLGGKVFPYTTRDFSSVSADLGLMKSQAKSGVNGSKYFDSSGVGREIILNSDGTFTVQTVKNYNNARNNISQYLGGISTYPIPDNGIIFVEDNIWLKGTLDDKRLTIVAANMSSGQQANVFIEGNVQYTSYDGSAILGIIAQNNVEIIRDTPTDITIDGAILAQNGRVGREYYTNGCGCGHNECEDHKGTLTNHGSIVTNERYGFAWTDSCPRNTGYAVRNLYFDNNLLYNPPPYFPTGTQYLLDLWEEL